MFKFLCIFFFRYRYHETTILKHILVNEMHIGVIKFNVYFRFFFLNSNLHFQYKISKSKTLYTQYTYTWIQFWHRSIFRYQGKFSEDTAGEAGSDDTLNSNQSNDSGKGSSETDPVEAKPQGKFMHESLWVCEGWMKHVFFFFISNDLLF